MKAEKRRDDQPASHGPARATPPPRSVRAPSPLETVAVGRTSSAGWKIAAGALVAVLVGVVIYAAPPPPRGTPATGAGLSSVPIPTPVVAGTQPPSPAASTPTRPPAPPRYEDGIPSSFDGDTVLRTAMVLGASERQLRDGFHLGAWSDGQCTGDPDGVDPAADPCRGVGLSDTPGGAVSERLRLRPEPGVAIPEGPMIIRAELLRRRCPDPDACVTTLSVEEVVWRGDEATDTAPLDAATAIAALRARFRDLRLTPYRESPTCGADWPIQVYWAPTHPAVRIVAVFPNLRARVAAEVSARTAGAPREPGDGDCVLARRRSVTSAASWVAVSNVLVLAGAEQDAAEDVSRILRAALRALRDAPEA